MSSSAVPSAALPSVQSPLVYLKLIFVALFWGGTFIAGRVLAQQMPPMTAASGRFGVAVLLLVVLAVIGYVLWLARRRKQIEAERRRRRRAQMEAEEARRRALAHETLREFDRDPAGSRRR